MTLRTFTTATGAIAMLATAVTAVPAAAALYHRYHGRPFHHPAWRAPDPAPAPARDRPRVATRMSPSFVSLDVGRAGFGPDRADGHFHRFGVFGWIGPLFWPYAWNDIDCSVFWSYWGWGCGDSHWSAGYGEPFWDYGTADIERALFTPFGFDDLAPYLPNGVLSVRRARSTGAAAGEPVGQMCGSTATEIAAWPVERIATLVTLDDDQRAALATFSDAALKAAQTVRDGCPQAVAFTPGHRLDTMVQRLQAMQDAVAAVQPALEGFYTGLGAQQQAKFVAAPPDEAATEAMREAAKPAPATGQAGTACRAASAAPAWPQARITAVLQPTAAQTVKLEALHAALDGAATTLQASCPEAAAATPPERLAAVSRRLAAMLAAVADVHRALDDLYDALGDTQQARFNRIASPP